MKVEYAISAIRINNLISSLRNGNVEPAGLLCGKGVYDAIVNYGASKFITPDMSRPVGCVRWHGIPIEYDANLQPEVVYCFGPEEWAAMHGEANQSLTDRFLEASLEARRLPNFLKALRQELDGPSVEPPKPLDPYKEHALKLDKLHVEYAISAIRRDHVEQLKRELDRKLVVMSAADDCWDGEL